MDEGLFCHVVEDHQFENAKLFYRFNNPDAVAMQKKERLAFDQSGWLERKGLTSWNPYWVELKGNVLKYYDAPRGSVKGSLNLLGCKVAASPLSNKAFEINFKRSSTSFRAENEEVRNKWVSVVCRAKDRSLEEREKVLEEWKRAGECTSCIAALASQQEEEEEAAVEQPETNETQKDNIPIDSETKKQDQGILGELLVLPLADVEEKTLTFKETFNKDVVVLALLRHFG